MACSIREMVQARANELGLTAYALAHASKVGGQFVVSVNHVAEYLAGRKDMTTAKLEALLPHLGLALVVAVKRPRLRPVALTPVKLPQPIGGASSCG